MQLCLRWFVAFCVPALPMSWQLWVQHLGCMLASRTKSDVQVWWPRERILSDEGVVRSQTQNHLRLRSGVKIPCFDEFWRVLQFRKGKVIWLMDSVNGAPDGSIVMFPVYTHVPYRIHFCCLKGESQIDQNCFPFFWQINAMTSTVRYQQHLNSHLGAFKVWQVNSLFLYDLRKGGVASVADHEHPLGCPVSAMGLAPQS